MSGCVGGYRGVKSTWAKPGPGAAYVCSKRSARMKKIVHCCTSALLTFLAAREVLGQQFSRILLQDATELLSKGFSNSKEADVQSSSLMQRTLMIEARAAKLSY